MKNSILNFNKRELENLEVSDFFSKDIDILSFLKEYVNDNPGALKNMFVNTVLTDNDKLERISFELFDTADYWDIILMLNYMDPLFSMPYSEDVKDKVSSDYAHKYFYEVTNLNADDHVLSQDEIDRIAALKEDFKENLDDSWNNFKTSVLPSTVRIHELVRLLKSNGYIK